MPQRINKRLGANAVISTLLKNISPSNSFREQFPNNYRIRRGTFVVQELKTREDGKKVLVVKHQDHGDTLFEVLPGNSRLDRAGPPNQYFALAQQQRQNEVNANNNEPPAEGKEGEEGVDAADLEPVEVGIANDAPPPPNHGWHWRPFRDNMETDW